MVRPARFTHQQTFHLGFSLRSGHGAEVNPFEFQRPALMGNHHRLSVNDADRGPQYLVSRDDGIERQFHRLHIEFSHQSHGF